METLQTFRPEPSSPEARAKAKLEFFIHLAVYLMVIGALAIVNLLTSPRYLWFLWPLLGWGIGVLMHGLGTFVFGTDSRFYQRLLEHERRPGA